MSAFFTGVHEGEVVVNGDAVRWKVRGGLCGLLWRYTFYKLSHGGWEVATDGWKSRTGAKEHGFEALGA